MVEYKPKHSTANIQSQRHTKNYEFVEAYGARNRQSGPFLEGEENAWKEDPRRNNKTTAVIVERLTMTYPASVW